jgi:hypothetical protein
MTVGAAVFYLDTDILRHGKPARQAAKNALCMPGGIQIDEHAGIGDENGAGINEVA